MAVHRLSDEELAAFARDGFVVVRGMYREHTARLQRWASEIAAWQDVPGKYAMYLEDSLREPRTRILSRVEQFIESHDGLRALVLGPSMKSPVAQLLGQPAALFKEKINYKLPGGGGFEPHQDSQAGWQRFAPYFISVMVSIDANTVENGCAEFAAGYHTKGLIGDEWKPLTGEQLNDVTLAPCLMEPGDAVIFDCYVPHRSAPNMTDGQRRNLYVTYNRASDGDFREEYFAEKRRSFPPDVEREPGGRYTYRV
jgi:hypothetical protein